MPAPTEQYQQALASGQYTADPNQADIVAHLEKIYQQLAEAPKRSWFQKKTSVKGLYIWGSVGVGKTWLMDLFFSSLTIKNKWRIHFHDFMREIHAQMEQIKGQANPLVIIAKNIAKTTQILCFDEFVVYDIADAMILGGLFQALFKENITVIATSNVSPDNLYKNGIQRERFLPAIELIKKNLDVMHLTTTTDYRLRELEAAGVFFNPPNKNKVTQLFNQLAHGEIHYEHEIQLHDRPITTLAVAENIIWFDFLKLCNIPRSQLDYLSITKRWGTVIVDNMLPIAINEGNLARNFINLIDILYDTKTILILNSAVTLENIYQNGKLEFEFQRTKSRLIEMQSIAYLEKAIQRSETSL